MLHMKQKVFLNMPQDRTCSASIYISILIGGSCVSLILDFTDLFEFLFQQEKKILPDWSKGQPSCDSSSISLSFFSVYTRNNVMK